MHMQIGSPGWITMTHYDFQHNLYIQMYGTKAFTLAPPKAMETLGLYPASHPLQRQTAAVLDEQSPFAECTVLRPSDVLYIPPLFLHTAAALSESTSFAMCSESQEERVYAGLLQMPIPLEVCS
jgi:ribosomal protein L16 Arg81 hydroxylase